MKTRRIHLQPDECVEVVNQYGTSILKATARFDGTLPVAVIYEQPAATILALAEAKAFDLTLEPIYTQPELDL